MEKVDHVLANMVFTHHGKQRRCQRKFSKGHIAACIAKGQTLFAGHLNKKQFKGLEVVYKIDNEGNFVIVSFYPLCKKTHKLNKLTELWNTEVV